MSEKSGDGDQAVEIEPEYEEDHPTAAEGVTRPTGDTESEGVGNQPGAEEKRPAGG